MNSSVIHPKVGVGEKVFLSIGSNQGDGRANINDALRALSLMDGVDINSASSFYLTSPVGMDTGQWFLNCAVEITTLLSPLELLDRLEEVERNMGRTQKGELAPRVIDMDILLYGRSVVLHPRLSVPHPRMEQRRFVLEPLAEIAPDAVHPVSGATSREMNERVAGQQSIRQDASPHW